MPNTAIAELIAAKLPDLTHPGTPGSGGPILLPTATYRTAGIPPEMAQQFAEDAGYPTADITRLIAEAIVHLIETDGDSTIVRNSELADMRAATAAAEPRRNRHVKVRCHCGTQLFTANIRNFDTDTASIAGPELIKAMRQFGTECATGHKAS